MYYNYETLWEVREAKELTQREVASVLGITPQQYSLYETGRRQMPLDKFKMLCEFYSISADYMLGLPKGLLYPDRL
ncbi:MAG: helix-turn-helix transcriptional regulator [Ruminococcaceae bacterium]|nr:helix-turn-helix transcriptional regulator [Oscillospiraceae bacterium]